MARAVTTPVFNATPAGKRTRPRCARARSVLCPWMIAAVMAGAVFVPGDLRGAAIVDGQVQLKVEFYNPNGWWDVCRVGYELMQEDPEVKIVAYSPLQIGAGLGYESAKIMAFAGNTAPDVMNIWFHNIQTYIDQDLLHPLNDFLGEDGYRADGTPKYKRDSKTGKRLLDQQGKPALDVNGVIDNDEAKWDYY